MKNKSILVNLRLLQKPYTGVQSYIYNLVKNMVKKDNNFKFYLITINYDYNTKFINELISYENCFLINSRGYNNPVYEVLFDIFFVNKYIKKHDLYFNPVNILPLYKIRKKKYITAVLDLCTFKVPNTTTLSLRLFYSTYLSHSLRRADKIVAISENTKFDLLNLFKINKEIIDIVYLGVDDDFSMLQFDEVDVITLGRKIGLNLNEGYFLTTGTSKRKNVLKVIDAFFQCCGKDCVDKLAIIIYSESMVDNYLAYMKRKNYNKKKVVFTGIYLTKKELKILYSKALMFIYCSVYEGFGLPVLEAMQCSCPVIASNTSSIPEVVNNAGLLVDPYDSVEISVKMKTLISDSQLRSKLIKKGHSNVRRFSWETTANKIIDIFKEVLEVDNT